MQNQKPKHKSRHKYLKKLEMLRRIETQQRTRSQGEVFSGRPHSHKCRNSANAATGRADGLEAVTLVMHSRIHEPKSCGSKDVEEEVFLLQPQPTNQISCPRNCE